MDNPPEVLIGQEYAIKSPSYLISRKKRHHWLPASGMTVPGWSVSQRAATSAGLFPFGARWEACGRAMLTEHEHARTG